VGTTTQQSFTYMVPGLRVVLAQAGPMTCWATVYTMMASWDQQASMDVRTAVAAVGPEFAVLYDAGLRANRPQGMPSDKFASFLTKAGMTHEPMVNLTIDTWFQKLQQYGLLWIGTLNSIGPGAGLHSRIIEGMYGSGEATTTYFNIIDPAGGRRYDERFDTFLAKYEGAFQSVTGEYFQIRRFN